MAIAIPHLPSRVHAFVWRNWQSSETSDMARVLGTSEENVRALAQAMGLPTHAPVNACRSSATRLQSFRSTASRWSNDSDESGQHQRTRR